MANNSYRVHEQFTRLYNDHKRSIFNYVLYRVGFDRDIAEDLTSEVFIKAFEYFDRYDQNRPFKTWIFTIAHNHLINFLTSRKKTISLDDAREIPQQTFSEMDLDTRMLTDKILALVAELPASQREVVILRYVNDLEYNEIAKILGKKEGAVRTALSRAITDLRKSYNLRFIPVQYDSIY